MPEYTEEDFQVSRTGVEQRTYSRSGQARPRRDRSSGLSPGDRSDGQSGPVDLDEEIDDIVNDIAKEQAEAVSGPDGQLDFDNPPSDGGGSTPAADPSEGDGNRGDASSSDAEAARPGPNVDLGNEFSSSPVSGQTPSFNNRTISTDQKRRSTGDFEKSSDITANEGLMSPGSSGQATSGASGDGDPDTGLESMDPASYEEETGLEDDSTSINHDKARDLERRFLEQSDVYNDPADVKIVEEDGRLVARPTDRARREATGRTAQELERRAIRESESITDDDQVKVVEEDGRLVTRLTGRGEREVRENRRRSAEIAATSDLRESTGAGVHLGAVSVEWDDEGGSPTGRELQRARQLEDARTGGSAEEYLGSQTGETLEASITDRGRRQMAADRFSDANPGLDRGEDFTVESTGGGPEARMTGRGRREAARTSGDMFSGVVSGTEDALTAVGQAAGTDRRVEFRGEGSVANVARLEATEAKQSGEERFGSIRVPETTRAQKGALWALGPAGAATARASREAGGEEVEKYTQAASRTYSEDIAGPVAEVVGDVGEFAFQGVKMHAATSPTAGGFQPEAIPDPEDQRQAAADITRRPEDEVGGDSRAETLSESFAGGTAGLFNVPRYADIGVQAAEFGQAGAESIAAGEGAEYAQEAAGAGTYMADRAASSAAERPGQTAAALAGGLIGSAGAIGAAGRLGGSGARTGAAWTIQPGEEFIGSAGFRATRRFAGEGAARRAFPNKQAPFMPEEATMRGASLAASGIRGAASRLRTGTSRLPSVRLEVDPEAGPITYEGSAPTVPSPDVRGFASRAKDAIPDPALGQRYTRRRLRAGEKAREVRERISGTGAPSMPGAPDLAIGQRYTKAELETRRRFGETRERIADINAPSMPGSAPSLESAEGRLAGIASRAPAVRGDATLQQSFTRSAPLPWSAPDLSFEVGGRLGGRASGARDAITRAADRFPTVRGDAALQQSFLRDSETPHSSPDLSGAAEAVDEQLFDQKLVATASEEMGRGPIRARETAARMRGARTAVEFDVGYHTARGNAPGAAETPRYEEYPGELNEGLAFRSGRRLGETAEAASSVPSGLHGLGSRAASAARRAPEARDLTLRIGKAEDSGTVAEWSITKEEDIMGHIDEWSREGRGSDPPAEREGKTDEPSAESGGEADDPFAQLQEPPAGDTGVAVERVYGGAALEAPKTRAKVEAEAAEPQSVGMPRVRSELGSAENHLNDNEVDRGLSWEVPGERGTFSVGQWTGSRGWGDVRTDTKAESAQDADPGRRTELARETRRESVARTRTESRNESRAENQRRTPPENKRSHQWTGLGGSESRSGDQPLAVGYLTETLAGFAGIDRVTATEAELESQSGSQPLGEFTPEFTGEKAESFDETLEFFGIGGDGGDVEGGWL